MRQDLARIVASFISNIGGAQVSSQYYNSNKRVMIDLAKSTCEGLDVIKENWPGLTQKEKEEIATIILALNTTYPSEEEVKTK